MCVRNINKYDMIVVVFVLLWIVMIGVWMKTKKSKEDTTNKSSATRTATPRDPRHVVWARRADRHDAWVEREFVVPSSPANDDVVPVDSANAHWTYDAIRVASGTTVRLYHKTTRDFRNWPLPTVVRTVEARETTVEVETPVFTHLRMVTDGEDGEPTEDVCNPMRIATVERVWPEACLPEGLRDSNRCGVDAYGHKVGNYFGLPTRCNEHVGDTLDANGFGVFRDPVRDLLTYAQNPAPDYESFRYPLTVPVFVNRVVDDPNEELPQYRVSRVRVPEAACERTYWCAAPNARALREMLENIRDGREIDTLLETCTPHTDTCNDDM